MKKTLFITFIIFLFLLSSCDKAEKRIPISEFKAETESEDVSGGEVSTATEEVTVAETETETHEAVTEEKTEEKVEKKTEEEKKKEDKKEEEKPKPEPKKSIDTFVAICNESMTLRKTASTAGKSVAVIKKGEEFTVLGFDYYFAKVKYKSYTGYVLVKYIAPKYPEAFELAFASGKLDNSFGITDVVSAANELLKEYPSLVKISSIGKSEDGRDIPVVVIGKAGAKKKVFIQAGIHGREFISSWLIMQLLADSLKNDPTLFSDVEFHVVPMSNPDGVAISQSAVLTETAKKAFLDEIERTGVPVDEAEYARQWKANTNGIDINRNFPDGWEEASLIVTHPGDSRYPGEAPFCTAEAKALRDYTLKYPFDATVSLHATGSEIYYGYGADSALIAKSKALADAVAGVTGYLVSEPTPYAVGAGYKDWAEKSLKIPSVTIELSRGDLPVADAEYYSTLLRNKALLRSIASFVLK